MAQRKNNDREDGGEIKIPGVYLYTTYREQLLLLSAEERGILVMAMLDYIEFGEYPQDLSPVLKMAFSFIKSTIDRDITVYVNKVAANRVNGMRGGRPPKNSQTENPQKPIGYSEIPEEPTEPNVNVNGNLSFNDNLNFSVSVNNRGDTETHTREEDVKNPSLEDVREYCKEVARTVSAQRFYDTYASKGWKTGDTSITDWKALLRKWDAENREKGKRELDENKSGYVPKSNPLDA